MSDLTREERRRDTALRLALQGAQGAMGKAVSSDQIVKVAEAFYKFLSAGGNSEL